MKKLKITVEGKSYDVTVEVLGDETPATPKYEDPIPLTKTPRTKTPEVAPVATVPEVKPEPETLDNGEMLSPIAGNVVELLVSKGDQVSKGQEILYLEALKMESPVLAPCDGTIEDIAVKEGDSVEEGQLLLKLSQGN